MSIENLERIVLDQGQVLVTAIQRASERDPQLLTRTEALLDLTRELLKQNRAIAEAKVPELFEYLRDRSEDSWAEFTQAPLLIYGTAQEEDVIERWREQLRANAQGLAGIFSSDRETMAEWLYWHDFEGPRKPAAPYFGTEQIRDCLKEIRKLLVLLSLPRNVLRVERGDTIAADDFSSGVGNWRRYGNGELGVDGGKMLVSGEGVSVWWEVPVGNGVISFDFQPCAAENDSAGALFAFPASPRPGKTLEASAGAMSNYNLGIDTYHCSLFRGKTARSNLRRAGRGLKMLSTIRPDPCSTPRKTYRVEIVKHGVNMQVFVDLRLIHAYVDGGTYGPILSDGKFGIRHFAGGKLDAYYGNVSASWLKVLL